MILRRRVEGKDTGHSETRQSNQDQGRVAVSRQEEGYGSGYAQDDCKNSRDSITSLKPPGDIDRSQSKAKWDCQNTEDKDSEIYSEFSIGEQA
jgi:hypothetical protein